MHANDTNGYKYKFKKMISIIRIISRIRILVS